MTSETHDDTTWSRWESERKSCGDLDFSKCAIGKLAQSFLTQVREDPDKYGRPKQKTRVVVNKPILQFLKPHLDTARVETFIDWFYDTPESLLLKEGAWLLRREPIESNTDHSWKLRVMVTLSSDDTMQWFECQTEQAIIQRLKESDIDVSSLPGCFQHIYLDVYTKRYHLASGLWIDFVGWYPYGKPEDAAVYAVCSAEQPLKDTAHKLFEEIKALSTSPGFAPSKTLVMLAHDRRKLFSDIFKYDPSSLFSVVHSGTEKKKFSKFDQYLGQEQAWKDFPVSDDEDDQSDDDEQDP